MTISTTSSQVTYAGDGLSTAFAYPYPFIASSDLKVYVNGALQIAGYSVAGNAPIGGSGTFVNGTVTFAAPPANGAIILLIGDPDLLQSTSLPPNDPFPSKTVEKMVDKLTLIVQRLYGKVSRAILAPDGESGTTLTLPSVSQRANNLLSFDSLGNVATVAPAAGTATALSLDLATSNNAAKGAVLVGFYDKRAPTYLKTVSDILNGDEVSILRFVPTSKHDGIRARTNTDDLTSNFADAIATADALLVPFGTFNINSAGTGLVLSKLGQRVRGEGGSTLINCPTGTLFSVTGDRCEISQMRLFGGYVANNLAITVAGARCSVHHLHMDQFDQFIEWTAGFHFYVSKLWTRNVRTRGFRLGGACTGCFMSDVSYDTDGSWYGGSFSEPSDAVLVVHNQGNVIGPSCDFIHGRIGARIEPNGFNIEWNKFIGSFLSDSAQAGSGTAGVLIRQSSNTYYIRGQFFSDIWLATNNIGMLIDGTGTADLDGIFVHGGQIHNNRNEGIRIAAGKNIRVAGAIVAANNSPGGSGTANNIYVGTAGKVKLDGVDFGLQFRWANTPLAHVYADTMTTDLEVLDPVNIDASISGTAGPIVLASGATAKVGFASWTLVKLVSPVPSGATLDINLSEIGSFQSLMLAFDNIAHDSTGDLVISLSADGGSTFISVSYERLQFNTGSEAYSNITGNRSIASGTNIQGSLLVQNVPSAYKHLTYNSGLNAASGQGLLVTGTANSLNPVNFIRLAWSAGNLTGGTVRLLAR